MGSLPCLHLSLAVAVRAVVIDILHPDKSLLTSILICHLACQGVKALCFPSHRPWEGITTGRVAWSWDVSAGPVYKPVFLMTLPGSDPGWCMYQGRVDSGPWRLPSLPRKRCCMTWVTWGILLNPKHLAFCKSVLDSSVSEK